MTAEFAITVPAVLLVLGLVLGSVHLAAERIALVSIAGEVARLEARGDHSRAASRAAAHPSVTMERSDDGRFLCVTATSGPRHGLLAALRVSGTGCAARSDAGSEG